MLENVDFLGLLHEDPLKDLGIINWLVIFRRSIENVLSMHQLKVKNFGSELIFMQ
jgi:hypothetical protein